MSVKAKEKAEAARLYIESTQNHYVRCAVQNKEKRGKNKKS